MPAAGRKREALHVKRYWLTPESDAAVATALIATPEVSPQTVPVRAACGKPVDWYLPSKAGLRAPAH